MGAAPTSYYCAQCYCHLGCFPPRCYGCGKEFCYKCSPWKAHPTLEGVRYYYHNKACRDLPRPPPPPIEFETKPKRKRNRNRKRNAKSELENTLRDSWKGIELGKHATVWVIVMVFGVVVTIACGIVDGLTAKKVQ